MFNRNSLLEAKDIFINILQLHIDAYDERLKKPWLKRTIKKITSSYDEKEYLRTKSFLNAMEDVYSTEDLIRLTNDAAYQYGDNLLGLLRYAAITVCGFNLVDIISKANELLEEARDRKRPGYNKHKLALALVDPQKDAIICIYNDVIACLPQARALEEKQSSNILAEIVEIPISWAPPSAASEQWIKQSGIATVSGESVVPPQVAYFEQRLSPKNSESSAPSTPQNQNEDRHPSPRV